MAATNNHVVLAAIDVGTNSVKLELARPLPNGSFETLHEERDPVRPGEGVFKTGWINKDVAERLLSALRRYGALCRRFHARVRAVATSAVREAKNREEIIRRARAEAGLNLEVVSGREEARLICLGVLHGRPAHSRALCVDIGGGSTEVASAIGPRPVNLWSISLGAVRLTELFDSSGKVSARQLARMREYTGEVVGHRLPKRLGRFPKHALGSSGTIKAVIGFAAPEGTAHVAAEHVTRAIPQLVEMGPEGRKKRFEPRRADIIIAGAVILEALASHLELESITAVDAGLRDGIIVDLIQSHETGRSESWTTEAAEALGRRFQYDEPHGRQAARISLAVFDALRPKLGLPASARSLLEVAALLHDVGNAVSYAKHHRHSYYIINNADIPGLADREREIVACVARFHRSRDLPDAGHPDMANLTRAEAQLVRKLAALLRVADSLDRSHNQPVHNVKVTSRGENALLHVDVRGHVDLELWDFEREAKVFQKVFGRKMGLKLRRLPRDGVHSSRS
ncbi:MAG TPA: Ppx/GppA phosphatase family protein [Myxococcaceae bacterium]|nr:Ppx/GppA phosphatase family protein [Myxococcaceae bacterium]